MSMTLKAARAGSQGGIRAGTRVTQGGIFSAVGGALKRVASVATNLLPGPVGAVARAGISVLSGSRAPAPMSTRVATLPAIGPTLVATGGGGPTAAPAGMPRPGAQAAIARVLPFGDTGLGSGCPSGYHPNKTGYMTRDGWVEKGSKCVRNRKRNPLNPRALDRSMGRLRSAGKAVRALGFKAPTVKEVATGRRRRKKK